MKDFCKLRLYGCAICVIPLTCIIYRCHFTFIQPNMKILHLFYSNQLLGLSMLLRRCTMIG
uniref:Uncharacterized protein n=1 Tax=Rhizophora mucronata TaxID=61149 RepID=A0A2P2MC97_RHIMU